LNPKPWALTITNDGIINVLDNIGAQRGARLAGKRVGEISDDGGLGLSLNYSGGLDPSDTNNWGTNLDVFPTYSLTITGIRCPGTNGVTGHTVNRHPILWGIICTNGLKHSWWEWEYPATVCKGDTVRVYYDFPCTNHATSSNEWPVAYLTEWTNNAGTYTTNVATLLISNHVWGADWKIPTLSDAPAPWYTGFIHLLGLLSSGGCSSWGCWTSDPLATNAPPEQNPPNYIDYYTSNQLHNLQYPPGWHVDPDKVNDPVVPKKIPFNNFPNREPVHVGLYSMLDVQGIPGQTYHMQWSTNGGSTWTGLTNLVIATWMETNSSVITTNGLFTNQITLPDYAQQRFYAEVTGFGETNCLFRSYRVK
jgi:hypothetical protein